MWIFVDLKCPNVTTWKHLRIYRLCGNKRYSGICTHCLGLLVGKITQPATRNFATFAILRFSTYINYLSERFLISRVMSI